MDLSLVLSKSEETSAHKLAAMLAVDPFTSNKQETGHPSIVKANLQYLAIMYHPFSQFLDWLERIFGSFEY